MKFTIDSKVIKGLSEEIESLSTLFDDRVSEYHKINGMQAERHAFVLYRKLLWGIRDNLFENIEEIVNDTKSDTKSDSQ